MCASLNSYSKSETARNPRTMNLDAVPLRDALTFLPERVLSAEEAQAVSHGRRIPAAEHARYTRLTRDGDIVAIAEPRDGELQPVVVFAPA